MTRRILAWLTLVGFLFLLVNLFWLKYMQEVSLGIYIVIVVVFLFTNSEKKREEREREEKRLAEQNDASDGSTD